MVINMPQHQLYDRICFLGCVNLTPTADKMDVICFATRVARSRRVEHGGAPAVGSPPTIVPTTFPKQTYALELPAAYFLHHQVHEQL